MRDEGKTREPVLRRNLPTSPTGNFEVTSPRRAIRPRDCCLSLAGSPQQRQALPPSGGGSGAARSSLPPKAARCLSCGHVQRQPIATTKTAGMVFAQADVRNVRLRTCVSNSDSKQQSKRDNPGRAVGGCRCRAANYIPVPQIHGSRRTFRYCCTSGVGTKAQFRLYLRLLRGRGTSGLHAHCRLFPGDGCLDARRELFLDKKKRPQRERVGSFISSLPRALFGKCPHLHRVPTISYPHTISLPPFPRNFNSFAYSAATSMHTTCSSAIYNHPLPTTPSPRMPGC